MHALTITYLHRYDTAKNQVINFPTEAEAVKCAQEAAACDKKLMSLFTDHIGFAVKINDDTKLYPELVMHKTLEINDIPYACYCVSETSETEKDLETYSRIQKQYVMKDVISYAADNDLDGIDKNTVRKVADMYVDQAEYDCNISYWDNIRDLIQRCRI